MIYPGSSCEVLTFFNLQPMLCFPWSIQYFKKSISTVIKLRSILFKHEFLMLQKIQQTRTC